MEFDIFIWKSLQQDALNAWSQSNRSEGQKRGVLKRAENNSKYIR